MSEAIFSIVPIDVFMDRRLTERQIRVLGALFSFRGRTTEIVWPSRAALAERCGLRLTDISTITRELEALGWLIKAGKGGFGRATRYTLLVPDEHAMPLESSLKEKKTVPQSGTVSCGKTVPESGTVPECSTVPESGTPTVLESGTTTVPECGTPGVPESGTPKEQTIRTDQRTNHRNRPNVCPEPKNCSGPSGDFSLTTLAECHRGSGKPPGAVENTVICVPLVGKDLYPVSQTQIDEWAESFPAVDVLQELRKIREWCISHPSRKKTRKGARGFITSWLGREQDRGKGITLVERENAATGRRAGDRGVKQYRMNEFIQSGYAWEDGKMADMEI